MINKMITKMKGNKAMGYAVVALMGVFVGWLLFSNPSQSDGQAEEHTEEKKVWICSMHPQIVMDKEGKCPICAMDLIPRQSHSSEGEHTNPDAIQMTPEALALANVQTLRVNRGEVTKRLRLYGKIVVDERGLQSQSAHTSGRIERLYVNFTGESVRVGQTLATIYSPDLLQAQQELLQAVAMQQSSLIEAAKEKLRLWQMTEAQIDDILRSNQVAPHVDIKATSSGVVTAKRVSPGDYVAQGSVLFDIARLSTLWAVFEVFEADLPFVKLGDEVHFRLSAFPEKDFSGRISFVDAVLNPTTRTARIRVDVPNPNLELKPEMLAMADVDAKMTHGGDAIVIPRSAVLWTGRRSVVYVREESEYPSFALREVLLGANLGESYVVIEGLEEGEEVVVDGAFTIDASAQLEGKRSMMNIVHTPTSAEEASILARGACGMCQERIEQAALAVPGVFSAEWSLENQQLKLSYDTKRTTLEQISQAIAKVGHDTENHRASDAVYEALPGCCHYR